MVQYAAGQKIRGSEINALPQIYRVSTPQICNNSVSFRDVVGLSFQAEINAWYLVECFLAYHATTVGDIKFVWVVPAGAVGGDSPIYNGSWWTANGLPTSASGNPGSLDCAVISNTSTLHARSGDNVSPLLACPVGHIMVGANPGTCKLQFAQNTNVVHDTTIRTGSCMRVTRMA
jgi:hypothetical protein